MSVSVTVEKIVPGFSTSPSRIVFRKDEKELSITLSEKATWINSIGMFETGKKDIFRNNVEREDIQDILEWFMK